MEILLIQPRRHPLSVVFGELEPYALEVLATSILGDRLLHNKVNIKIIDLRFDPIDSLVKRLNSSEVKIVGITGITIDAPGMLDVAKIVKHYSAKTLVIAGGHHATMCPEDFFHPEVDLIVRGFGSHVFLNIVKKKLSGDYDFGGLKGVIQQTELGDFVECSGWVDNIFDSPPKPSRNFVNRRRYRSFGKNMGVVVTAQGCAGRCTFCGCWPATGGKYIMKSPEEVAGEIIETPEKYIFLGDDNTFGDIERAIEIARLLKKNRIDKQLEGYCRADIIANYPNLIEQWSKVGLKRLTVGFEDISDQGLKSLNKNSTIEINEEANNILKKYGIVNYAHILIRPDFVIDDFIGIREYIYKLGIVEPVFPILTPLPGTVLWHRYKKELFSIPRQFFDLGHPLTKMNMSITEFYNELFKLVEANYAKKRWIKAKLKGLVNALLTKRVFPRNETAAAELLSTLISYSIFKKRLNQKKIHEFLKAISIIQKDYTKNKTDSLLHQ